MISPVESVVSIAFSFESSKFSTFNGFGGGGSEIVKSTFIRQFISGWKKRATEVCGSLDD